MRVPQVLLTAKERTARFLKDFEWSWTTAVLFCLGFAFFCVISMAVIPSFWVYFAQQKLGWDGTSGNGQWQPLARDAVALGFASGPFITAVVIAVIFQNWRRKLRGGSSDRPTGGYR